MVFYTRILNYLFWIGLLICLLQFCYRARRRGLETRIQRDDVQVTPATASTSNNHNNNDADEENDEDSQRLRSEVLNAMFPEQKLDSSALLVHDEESNGFKSANEDYRESSCSICLETFGKRAHV
mmetsp:Transcript_14147/g.21795  ORF Transcript_14147/g.21795 Transcript_14147/m.21795 type:complete len:125 (+) Transcript_14147:80-454(+)